MTDKPLTEKDFQIPVGVGFLGLYRKVQSAKRLLKWELLNGEALLLKQLPDSNLTEGEMIIYTLIRQYCEKISEIPDACFQIDDNQEAANVVTKSVPTRKSVKINPEDNSPTGMM